MNANASMTAGGPRPGELAPGSSLQRYRIHRVLGRGGFATSYLATDTRLCRRVALKQCIAGARGSAGEDVVARCVAEARTLARFSHPNIVRVFNVFTVDDTGYIALEYQSGRHLSEMLRRTGCPRESALCDLLRALLDGVEHVHAEGFIHRDIKPANIYVRADETPLLLDFGSAVPVLPSVREDATALVSAGYASLEQHEGTAQGPWTDVYGLGASLYVAVTRRAPVDARRRAAAIRSGCEDPMRPAAALAAGKFSPRLLGAIDAALALHARERPCDVAEWRKLLNARSAPYQHHYLRRHPAAADASFAPWRASVFNACGVAASWRERLRGWARPVAARAGVITGAVRAVESVLAGTVAAMPRPHAVLITALSLLLVALAAQATREREGEGADDTRAARSGFIRRQPAPGVAPVQPPAGHGLLEVGLPAD